MAALSPDNVTRRKAEERIGNAARQRGFAVALAAAVERRDGGGSNVSALSQHLRLMAGAILQRFVQDYWEYASYAVLPPEDKAQVRGNICLFCTLSVLSLRVCVPLSHLRCNKPIP